MNLEVKKLKAEFEAEFQSGQWNIFTRAEIEETSKKVIGLPW